MVTTHGKVDTERKSIISTIHSLLRSLEILDVNQIEPRGGKDAARRSIHRELFKAQNMLDAAPNDPSPGGEKKG